MPHLRLPKLSRLVTSTYRTTPSPGIRLWLDGNNLDGDTTVDTTADGTGIIQWIDQSGNTNHAGQATADNRPTYGAAGLNSKGWSTCTSGQSLDISSDANIR